MPIPNHHITILLHDISYYYHDDGAMDDSCQEHVQLKITEGYNQGELCAIRDGDQDKEVRGWWHIKSLVG